MGLGFRNRIAVLAGSATCVAALAFAPSALSNTYTVTRTDDPTPSGCHKHNCSLREAMNAANSHPGADTVILQGGKTYNLTIPRGQGGDANSGDLDITDKVTVTHSGPRRATVNAHRIDSVFELGRKTGGAAKLMGLVLEGGEYKFGGAIDVEHGSLTLLKSIVRGNRATSADGGGITIYGGSARIVRSFITHNRAAAKGGGIFNGAHAVILDSTISGNTSIVRGGGVANRGTLTMRNDTVTKNSTEENGGGVSAGGGSTLLNDVTIARNEAASANGVGDMGGGIYHGGTSGTFTISNSLIALNTFGSETGNTDPNCSGTFTSAGNNMRTSNDPGCAGFTANGDFVHVHPKIGPLAHNGGPTETIALLTGSPAINKANPNTSEKRDQRGHKRDAKRPDIGAFEAAG